MFSIKIGKRGSSTHKYSNLSTMNVPNSPPAVYRPGKIYLGKLENIGPGTRTQTLGMENSLLRIDLENPPTLGCSMSPPAIRIHWPFFFARNFFFFVAQCNSSLRITFFPFISHLFGFPNISY